MTHNLYKQQKIALFLVVSISFLMGIGIDLYVPSLPDMAHFYHANISYIQLTISLYLLGYGLGQIILGSLSDSYGRRKIFIASSMVFSISSMLCIVSDSIIYLNLFRLLQGLAIAGLASGMRAIIVDLFSGLELKKMANYFALSWAIGPIVAPFIGANLADKFGWQANFYLFTVYGIILFFVCTLLFKESNKNIIHFNVKNFTTNLVIIITNKDFTLLSIIYGLSYSTVLIFNTVGPYLIEVKLNYSILFYGNLAMFLGCAYFIGTMINRYLIIQYDNKSILQSGIILSSISSIVMLLLMTFHQNIFTLTVPIFAIFVFIGLIVPNAIAITMTLFPKQAGMATSLCGTIVGLIVFSVTYIIGLFKVTPIELAINYISIFIIINFIKYSIPNKKH
ncbi:Bcr/CflA family efflux MFS transporter [Photobacterium damselae]|uniref:Bcr/CflA family efflux transporter n=2 Tax=Photobacterium damselae TaxID=38293 RepID=D0Z2U7_PHODD|nr:Bcr/CflA family efflux MFS transporter [Photobacterium damselae]EEZ39728.1 drug resistance transporter Bcr/CflA family [Photobacterium damselae subsp. damselae CIP 102761]PSW77620.1 Bcr/CflA family drug resistance efflux transporter [Photobacterium damselae]SPY43820.1 Sulfonamide resistance protein [Photobacterium damselae]